MLKKLASLMLLLTLIMFSGCAAEQQSETLMNEFKSLAAENTDIEEVAAFLTKNIAHVSKEKASQMVIEFEKMQKNNLSQLQTAFLQYDIQNEINVGQQSITDDEIINDPELKAFLTKLKNSGYKVDTAEGMYYLIIDYQFYKKFSPYVTADMQDYIEIMAEESNHAAAKDAALLIGWDDVVKRALNQEKFILQHSDSVKADEVMKLFNRYVTFTLYGLDNTPLFGYDTGTINPQAKEAYLNALQDTSGSRYLKALNQYLEVLERNNFMLTTEVKNYREQIMEKFSAK